MYAFGYFLPLILSVHPLTVACLKEEVKDGYFREDACWLDDNYIFAFEVPITLAIFFNSMAVIHSCVNYLKVALNYALNRKRCLT